jgi:hypothetical protein
MDMSLTRATVVDIGWLSRDSHPQDDADSAIRFRASLTLEVRDEPWGGLPEHCARLDALVIAML